MRHYESHPIGPTSTPDVIKYLIFTSIGISLIATLFAEFFDLFSFIMLSLQGIKHLFVWQFVSYLFIVPARSFSFNFVLHLIFNAYILWVFGTSIADRFSAKKFLLLYFASGIFAALIALATMSLLGSYQLLDGNFIPLFAVLIVWMKQNPSARLNLFFTIPFDASFLILALLGINLLIDLSNKDFVRFFASLSSALVGYLFSFIVLEHVGWKVFQKNPFSQKYKTAHKAKKYDFQTQKPISDDEEFVDAMLEKVATHGESALSKKEKKRLNEISKRKSV